MRRGRKATGPLRAVSRVAWIFLAELMSTCSSVFFWVTVILDSGRELVGETTPGPDPALCIIMQQLPKILQRNRTLRSII